MRAKQQGQILIIAVIFLAIILLFSGAILGLSGQNVIATRNSLAREQAVQLADAGIEKAIWQLNQSSSYAGENGTVLGAATGEFDVVVADLSGGNKEVAVTAYVPSKANPRVTRTVKAELSISTETISFNYAVQVGNGGLQMDNNSRVTGSIYSNGTVDGSTNARITGDVFSAGASGRIFDRLQIDGSAYANRIDSNVQIGGNAFGQTMNQVTVGGNVFTNTISNCTVGGNVNYTTISSCVVGGNQNPGYPGEPDPEPLDYPITDQNIADWKTAASSGGTIVGNFNVSGSQTLGPKKITGNLSFSNNSTLTLTGALWVEGNISTSNNTLINLDPAYGSLSEVIISDSEIDLANNTNFSGAGTDSYIMMVSTKTSGDAFSLSNNTDSLIIFAPDARVDISNNAIVREVTANEIHLNNNAEISYESGLANVNFSTGPGGSWGIVRGTWRITQ